MKESIYIVWQNSEWVALKNSEVIFKSVNVQDVIEYVVSNKINQNRWIKIENKFGTLREAIPFIK